jgi:hypothetical protein
MSCGIGLMVFPYFISNMVLLVIFGIVLMALPYFIKIQEIYSEECNPVKPAK